MVLHWPNGIKSKGEIRSQFHHVIDVAPTVLEAAGLPQPTMVNGTAQYPMDGISMLYTVDDAQAKDRRTTQYFEMFGNRGIYHEGWVACTRHSIPWLLAENPPLKDDTWELYNIDEDFSEANNLAATNPDKLKELQEVFTQEAIRNHVFPIDDRRSERFNAAVAGRPDLLGQRTSLTVYEGMVGIAENAFINVKGTNYAITADVEIPSATTNGVIIAQAGRFGGWTLYMKNGKLQHEYNYFGLEHTKIASAKPVGPGTHTFKYEFNYDGGKPGSGGTGILSIDGEKVGEGKIAKTQPFLYSADEGVDVGLDAETAVSNDYPQGNNTFTGRIVKIKVETFPASK